MITEHRREARTELKDFAMRDTRLLSLTLLAFSHYFSDYLVSLTFALPVSPVSLLLLEATIYQVSTQATV